jgi:hypothetical protein
MKKTTATFYIENKKNIIILNKKNKLEKNIIEKQ